MHNNEIIYNNIKIKTILFSLTENKFINEIIDYYNEKYIVLIDNFMTSTEEQRHILLNNVDIIFCEWCDVNAVFYSVNKKPHQKLFIRLHRYEIEQDKIYKIEWKNVNQLIFISQKIKTLFNKKLLNNSNYNKFVDIDPRIKHFNGGIVIHNYVKSNMFTNKQKNTNNEFNIGIMGILSKLKRPDIAIDIIEHLIKINSKFKLHILSKNYKEIPWLANNINESKYYEKLFKRINDSNLKSHVIFSEFTDNPEKWFDNIGYILSVSDIEGSHQAVAEGMATGTIPFIYGGALVNYELDKIYPKKYCYYDFNILCEKIIEMSHNLQLRHNESEYCKKFSYENFKFNKIINKFNDTIFNNIITNDTIINGIV